MACPGLESSSWHVSRRSDGAFCSQFLSFQAKHPPPGGRGGLDVANQGNRGPESTRQVVSPPPRPPPKAQSALRRCFLLPISPPPLPPPPKPNACARGPTFSNPMLPPFHPLYRVIGGPTAALADQPRPSPAPTLYPWPPMWIAVWPNCNSTHCRMACPGLESPSWHVSRRSDGAFCSQFLAFQAKCPPPGGRGGLDVANQGNRGPESTRQVVSPPPRPPPKAQSAVRRRFLLPISPPPLPPPPKPNACARGPTFSNPMLPPFHPLYRVIGGPTASGRPTSPLPCTNPIPLAPHTDPWPCGPAVSQYTAAWRVLGPNPPPGIFVGAPTMLSAPKFPPSSAPPPQKPNACARGPTFSNLMLPQFRPLYRVIGGPTATLADQPHPSPAPTLYPWPPMLIPGRVAQL